MSLHVPAHYVVHNLGARRVFFGACMSLHVPAHYVVHNLGARRVFFGACVSLHVPTHYVVHNLGARRVLFWSLHEPTCANALCCPQPRCETCVVFGSRFVRRRGRVVDFCILRGGGGWLRPLCCVQSETLVFMVFFRLGLVSSTCLPDVFFGGGRGRGVCRNLGAHSVLGTLLFLFCADSDFCNVSPFLLGGRGGLLQNPRHLQHFRAFWRGILGMYIQHFPQCLICFCFCFCCFRSWASVAVFCMPGFQLPVGVGNVGICSVLRLGPKEAKLATAAAQLCQAL